MIAIPARPRCRGRLRHRRLLGLGLAAALVLCAPPASASVPLPCGTLTGDATVGASQNGLLVVTCDVTVAAGATLTVEPDTVVKVASGRKLIVDGRLIAEGTGSKPVTFTSARDDRARGDTNRDGSETEPAPGDWQGIVARKGGSVELRHTVMRNAVTAVRGEPGAEISVRDSFLRHLSAHGVFGFKLASVTVTGTSVGYVDGAAMIIHSPELDPDRLSGNSVEGRSGGMQLAGTFTRSGALDQRGLIVQIGTDQRDDLTIAPDVTVALPAGEVVKATSGRKLIVDGRLIAEGTGSKPVTFTSARDDRARGDTNRDGSETEPAPGDWQGIVANRGSTVRLDMAILRYAATALTARSGADVEVHGRIVDSVVGVAGSAEPVDATNVYWGDPSGPAPFGTGVPVTGSGVLVQPWTR